MKVYQARSFTDYQHKRSRRDPTKNLPWYWMPGITDPSIIDGLDRTRWDCRKITSSIIAHATSEAIWRCHVPYVLYGRPLSRSLLVTDRPGIDVHYTILLGCVCVRTKEK